MVEQGVHETSVHTESHGAADHAAHNAASHDVTVLLGRTLPFPIYTVVFGILAVVTLIEVVISELPSGIVGNALLIGLSLMKAVLVVMFYMHLREDSRIFALALAIPLFIALVSILFLFTVPQGGY